ncbi:hypothetical protein ACFL1I_01030 [Candidatus Omnitrophota bacterium]
MPSRKTIPAIIGWTIVVLVLAILGSLIGGDRTTGFRATIGQQIKTSYNNFLDSIFWSRKPPLTTIALEENLKRSLPRPFASFDRGEWDWFWHLLYGRFPDEGTRYPQVTRQLDQAQVQEELAHYYAQPFANFGERQWGIFWIEILEKKVFK